jgi:hypothetical protein
MSRKLGRGKRGPGFPTGCAGRGIRLIHKHSSLSHSAMGSSSGAKQAPEPPSGLPGIRRRARARHRAGILRRNTSVASRNTFAGLANTFIGTASTFIRRANRLIRYKIPLLAHPIPMLRDGLDDWHRQYLYALRQYLEAIAEANGTPSPANSRQSDRGRENPRSTSPRLTFHQSACQTPQPAANR